MLRSGVKSYQSNQPALQELVCNSSAPLDTVTDVEMEKFRRQVHSLCVKTPLAIQPAGNRQSYSSESVDDFH